MYPLFIVESLRRMPPTQKVVRARCSAWKISKVKQKGANRNQTCVKGELKGTKCINESIWFQASIKDAKASYKCLHFRATWSILCAILAPAGFRRADPLVGVSGCVWRNRKNQTNHFFYNCTTQIENCEPRKT